MTNKLLADAIDWAERKLSQSHSIEEWDEIDNVRTLLAAARAQVPREPTEAMLKAGFEQHVPGLIWRVMWDASPINALPHETED